MSYETITYENDSGIGRITLNDPASLNAFNAQMGADLEHVFARMESDSSVRAAILTGAGRGFCSGANLAQRGTAPEAGNADAGAVLERYVNPLVAGMQDRRVPLVTAVNGPAAGVGLSLALMGDFVLAAESAFFLLAFTRIGLVPDGGATHILARRIGLTRALEMALLADRVPAAQALAWGMVNRICPDEELVAAATAIARRLADGPASISQTRRLMLRGVDTALAAQLAAERSEQRLAGATMDFREGVAAFLEKRPARFSGS
jgi:2-(1,2-epoxy-1,2-dihydrophenyl)acetyl-CoA isomerase